jgi:tetratricopeptide (TPR) repeat protein
MTRIYSDLDINKLKQLADSLMDVYNASQSTAALEEAIVIYEQVLDVTTARHENRAQSANDLGDALFWFCHRHNADKSRGDLCISLLREALHLRTLGNPMRDQSLHSLARALRVISFEQQSGGRSALDEAAALDREALHLRSLGHVNRASSLNNLAIVLMTIFEHAGDFDVLTEATIMQREVLQLLAPHHPGRITCLINLGNMLRTTFQLQGNPEILAEAIRLRRECVQICHVGHPRRPLALEALASTLTNSFVYQRQADVLSEAINLQREALQLLPESYPGREIFLGNFGDMLLLSYHEQGGVHVLSEALTLFRTALSLQSLTGRPLQSHRLSTLAKALQASFDLDGNTDTLGEAISLHREALEHQSPEYPARTKSLQYLADALCKLSPPSWTEAFALYSEALETSRAGDINRAGLFSALARCFLDPRSPFFDLSDGIVILVEGHADSSSHVKLRLRYSVTDLRYVEDSFSARTASARANAESDTKLHKQVMALYSQAMALLPRAANFGLDHDERLDAVAGSDELARNAAARAILLGNVTQAVEFLEEGRGVFWSQALRLKATGFDGVPDGLRDELKRLLSQLERSARKLEIFSQTTAAREQETETRRRLNEEAEDMISTIRSHPGLDRFLMPPAFSAIMASLPDGYVVIVNASRLGHHALILHRATDQVVSLELKPPRGGFDFALARAHLPRDGSVSLDAADGGTDYDSRGMRLVASKTEVDSFDAMLALLWTSIVQPVISALGLEVSAVLGSASSTR